MATSTVRASSRTCGLRKTIPRVAPRPEATTSATGVARPRAHGQAMTRTVIATEIEVDSERPSPPLRAASR